VKLDRQDNPAGESVSTPGANCIRKMASLPVRAGAFIVLATCRIGVAGQAASNMTRTAPHGIGLAAAILVLSAALCMPAHAQQANDRGATQGSQSQPGAVRKPAKPATAKPTGKSTTAGAVDMRVPQTRQWTLDDALPSRTRTQEPIVSGPELGRVPVQGGSFGVAIDPQVDPYRTPDGSRIRGLESTKSDPSYFGLSLSVPRDDKSLLPSSILPSW
jgi:hypothetical protein